MKLDITTLCGFIAGAAFGISNFPGVPRAMVFRSLSEPRAYVSLPLRAFFSAISNLHGRSRSAFAHRHHTLASP